MLESMKLVVSVFWGVCNQREPVILVVEQLTKMDLVELKNWWSNKD